MAKSSKSCGYTGHMRVMDRVNNTKSTFESNNAKSHGLGEGVAESHPKHKVAYPEVTAEARASIRGKCNCSKLSKN